MTEEVGGKQYVAVATNEGSFHIRGMLGWGGIAGSPNTGATLWVFALPD